MLKPSLAAVGFLVTLVAAYLLTWPVPVKPQAWQAPVNRGYVDPYQSNDLLSAASGIHLGTVSGPEDATLGDDNRVYVTTADGLILRVRNRGVSEFADVGGRPLGIESGRDGSLLVANAFTGIQRISRDGDVTTILDQIDGEPIDYANSLAVGANGIIYFSIASKKFGAEKFGGTLEASLLDILEHGGHGSVYAFDAETETVSELMTGLNFANGVAISPDGEFLLVAETGAYRILKFWLQGERAGTSEVLLDNLPGFPDNIKNGLNGRFWVGFAAPRNEFLDDSSAQPLLRKIVQRLPAAFRPQPEPFSHVIAINGDGDVLMNMHDPAARFPILTGVLETRDTLYLTTLVGNQLPRIAKRDL